MFASPSLASKENRIGLNIMKLHRIMIRNFRLLADAELFLEDETTVIVGRNNSGKTSLAEVVRRFTDQKKTPVFQIQDFSIECYEQFCGALEAHNQGQEEPVVRGLLPYIELRMFFRYDLAAPLLGPLGEFVVDLNMECDEALVVLRYELTGGVVGKLFEGCPTGDLDDNARRDFFRLLSERLPQFYTVNVWAEDPNDSENRKSSSQASVRALLATGFINAQRGLDDITTKESDVLAKVLEGLFATASREGADGQQRQIAQDLAEAVRGIQENIDGDFRSQLSQLLPALRTWGYPGLGGSELTTETTLNVQGLLTNHTKVRYEGHSGILLPESYNGLGMRNLIFILLQVVSYYRDFRTREHAQSVQVIFIEEPEAHLHPQMQEVFIRQLSSIVTRLNEEHADEPLWPVQFILSTHSSHVANEARFDAIRYFLPCQVNDHRNIWTTRIKDLKQGLSETREEDKRFLHQYLTLTRCDLFFADKAILVEGTSERLMMPVMIDKHDQEEANENTLRSQYISMMEVGGAYAHKFFELLTFLELPSLILTDLDPVSEGGGKKCLVHQGGATSNACINAWFGDPPNVPVDLIGKSEHERTRSKLQLCFQIPEADGGPCGRTFEDAFLIANAAKFGVTGQTPEEQEESAWQRAEHLKKSEFALTFAIDDTDWQTPSYIAQGLAWLAAISIPTGAALGGVTQGQDGGGAAQEGAANV
jgi:putative ATP-dependent endonuclease of the OLD family